MRKNKAAVLAMIVVAAMLFTSLPAFAFSPNESRSVENFFIEARLLKGDGAGYGLEKTASRLEGIIILIRLMGKEAEAQRMKDLPCRFADVPDWAAGYINYADSENISKGVSNTRFGANDKISAHQYNTLLLRVLGYDDSRGDFQWNDSVGKAEKLSILPSDMAKAYARNGDYTKGDLLETSFCYLEASYKGQERTLMDMLSETGVISAQLAEKYGLGIEGWYSVKTGYDDGDYLNFAISGSTLTVSGTSGDKNKTYLIVQVNDTKTGTKKADGAGSLGSDGQYRIELSLAKLPQGEYYVDVYGNSERYNYYTSIVLSSLVLQKTGNQLILKASPSYGQNLRNYLGNQLAASDSVMTQNTRSTPANVTAVSDLAKKIVAGAANDYEKLQAIHDWVANEIYYDRDFLRGKSSKTNINTIAVLTNKSAVCSGYSNLTHDLLVAAGIPSRQVVGYGLGITETGGWDELDLGKLEPNHVWNEAYVGGRWVVMDVTWDSSNNYEDGQFMKGKGVSQLYFDASLPFFSNTHRTMLP